MRIFKTKEYRIASVSGKLLTAAEDGAVTVEEQDGQKAQRWKFIPTDGAYRICNLQYQKMLDIIAGGTVNGAWVHLWDEVEAASQLWTAEIEGDRMRLRSVSSDKYLDVALQDNAHVQIWEKAGENQLWTLEVVEKEKSKGSTALKKKETSAIKHKEPSAIKKPDPTAIKHKEPSAIKHKEPSSIKQRESAPIAKKPASPKRKKKTDEQ